MNKEIVNIINDWNPIKIYPLLEDEYYPEIKSILEFIVENENITANDLAVEIDKIFIEFFGTNIYTSDIIKCKEILLLS